MPTGLYTRHEIASQPEAWEQALATFTQQHDQLRAFFQAGAYDSLLFIGCGSTYYLSLAAASVAQELCGLPARGVPASELWLDLQHVGRIGKRPLLIAVSRSGATTETLHACRAWQAAGGDLLTVSCYPDQLLARMGNYNLVLESGQEQSIAQTRAFSTLYLGCVYLACCWAGQRDVLSAMAALPATGRRVLTASAELAQRYGNDLSIERMYVLGSGARYGIACEASLKLKEMSLSHSEPFHILEFRHGPKSMVQPETLVIGLCSEAYAGYEQPVFAEMRQQGGRTLVLGDQEADVSFESGLPEVLRSILFLLPLQQLAFARSLARGLDPDRPLNLDAVVRLDGPAVGTGVPGGRL